MNQRIDMNFGVHPVALNILMNLKHRIEQKGLFPGRDFQVSPFYNGRERAVMLVPMPKFAAYNIERVHFVFGEVRNSDQIFIDTFRCKPGMNPYSLESLPEGVYEKAYNSRETLDVGEEIDAANRLIQYIAFSYMSK